MCRHHYSSAAEDGHAGSLVVAVLERVERRHLVLKRPGGTDVKFVIAKRSAKSPSTRFQTPACNR